MCRVGFRGPVCAHTVPAGSPHVPQLQRSFPETLSRSSNGRSAALGLHLPASESLPDVSLLLATGVPPVRQTPSGHGRRPGLGLMLPVLEGEARAQGTTTKADSPHQGADCEGARTSTPQARPSREWPAARHALASPPRACVQGSGVLGWKGAGRPAAAPRPGAGSTPRRGRELTLSQVPTIYPPGRWVFCSSESILSDSVGGSLSVVGESEHLVCFPALSSLTGGRWSRGLKPRIPRRSSVTSRQLSAEREGRLSAIELSEKGGAPSAGEELPGCGGRGANSR